MKNLKASKNEKQNHFYSDYLHDCCSGCKNSPDERKNKPSKGVYVYNQG
jgi:hypothetical protein